MCHSSDADLGEAVPQTDRLDCSAYRAIARLTQGVQRKRPSRNKLRESAKSTQSSVRPQVGTRAGTDNLIAPIVFVKEMPKFYFFVLLIT